MDAGLTKELQRAIAAARSEGAHIGDTGIGVPLTDKDMTATAAHVLPPARGDTGSEGQARLPLWSWRVQT